MFGMAGFVKRKNVIWSPDGLVIKPSTGQGLYEMCEGAGVLEVLGSTEFGVRRRNFRSRVRRVEM